MNIKMLKAAFAGLILSVSGLASAGIITYGDDLSDGALNTSNGIDVYDDDKTSLWDVGNLWTVSVNAGDQLVITARRLTDFDPMMAIWEGVELDTTGFVRDSYGDGNSTVFIANGDDELQANVGNGSIGWGDPQVVFTAARTSIYTVAVFALEAAENEEHMYSVQVEGATGRVYGVPEPSALALLAIGIVGLASRRFKKKY